MTAMDKQNRLCITENIRAVVNLNFEEEIRIYLNIADDKTILLSNDKELDLPCFGVVGFDKKYRFFIPKEIREYLNLTYESKLLVYSRKGNLVIHKV
ncbi:MAG: hypothetical protein IKK84_05550 [Clostridia bacterium]|nr:hypothetical protein [Clostridia bacterium]